MQGQTEEDFTGLIEILQKSIGNISGEKDTTEWDINALYSPNHACIWNLPSLIGKPCAIVQKNDEFALVMWEGTEEIKKLNPSFMQSVYRLEDLYRKD